MAEKLYYFNARGRAEQTRLLLTYVGANFEDIRFDNDEWKRYKDDMPFNQVPALDINGTIISQSLAIQRYVANKYGLRCGSLLDDARADMIAYSINDMRIPFRQIILESDPKRRNEMRIKYEEEELPKWLEHFENVLQQGGHIFMVGDKLTWIDLTFVSYMDPDPYTKYCKVKFDLSGFPLLNAYYNRLLAEEGVKQWLDTRPHTEF